MESGLEREFEDLTYEEIETVLDMLGTRFAVPISTISKSMICGTLEFDNSPEAVRASMRAVRAAIVRRTM